MNPNNMLDDHFGDTVKESWRIHRAHVIHMTVVSSLMTMTMMFWMDDRVRRVLRVNDSVPIWVCPKFLFLFEFFAGYRHNNGTSIAYAKQNGRKLPPTPQQPSTLQIPFKPNINFPKLDTSPSMVRKSIRDIVSRSIYFYLSWTSS